MPLSRPRSAPVALLALVAAAGIVLGPSAAVADDLAPAAEVSDVLEVAEAPAADAVVAEATAADAVVVEAAVEPAIDIPTRFAADVPITSISPEPLYAWSTVVVTGTKTAGTAVATYLYSPNLGESEPFECTGAGEWDSRGGNVEWVFITGDPGTTWSCTFQLTETVQQIGETILFYTGEGFAGETLLPTRNVIRSVVAADPVGNPTLSITPENLLLIDWVSTEPLTRYIYSVYNPLVPTQYAMSTPLTNGEFIGDPILSIVQPVSPGWWVIDIEVRHRAQPVGARTVTVYIPSPPSIDTATPLANGRVTFSGTGEPDSSVDIIEGVEFVPELAPVAAAARDALSAAAVPGDTVCNTTVNPDGTWSCTTGVLTPGEKQFFAKSNAPLSSSLPVAGSYLAGGTFANTPIAATVLGLPAPVVPPAPAPGPVVNPPVISPVVTESIIEIVEDSAPQPEPVTPVEEPAARPSPAGGSAPDDRSDPVTPSALTGALPTLGAILSNPIALAAGSGFALALMLLVAIPSELLNSTLSSGGHRLGRGYLAVQGALARLNDRVNVVTRSPVISAALLVLVMSVVFGFNDPDYGFDAVSVRLTLSMATSIFIVYCLAALLSGAIMKRIWGIESRLEMLPTALLLAVLGVVIARLIGFTPGFLIGLAIGLAIVGVVPAALRAKAILLQLGVVLVIGVAAFLAYSAIRGIPSTLDSVVGVFVEDTLVAIVAESLTGLFIVLLPLAFFHGRELWEHSKLIWVVSFMTVATAFSVIVLPTASDQVTSVFDLIPWLIPVVIYAVIVFGLWWWLSRNDRKANEAAEAEREKDYVG